MFLVRDSEEIAALYFLCVDERILGVVERAILASMSEIELLEDVEDVDNGRLGVKGAGLVGLPPAGVLGTAIGVVGCKRRKRKLNSTLHVRHSSSSPDRHPVPDSNRWQTRVTRLGSVTFRNSGSRATLYNGHDFYFFPTFPAETFPYRRLTFVGRGINFAMEVIKKPFFCRREQS
jgi:hypothetical protein